MGHAFAVAEVLDKHLILQANGLHPSQQHNYDHTGM